jgi:GNAT superfamily N-acetyltransferase
MTLSPEQFSLRRTAISDTEDYLYNFSVPEKGQGQGTAAMKKITAEADAAGKALSLHVSASNERAVNLYTAHGFSPADDDGSAFGRDYTFLRRSPVKGDV